MQGVLDWFAQLGPGVIPMTLLILYGAIREYWVWGYVFRRELKEKEYWRDMALSNLGLIERSVTTAEEAVLESPE